MSAYFPRHTADWRIEEPAALRKLTMSVIEMAVITGVALRLFRSVTLTYAGDSWIYLGGTFAIGVIVLFGMMAAHVANYTLKTWLWRVPAFALLESAAEIATSAVLIAFHREPLGSTDRAEFADLPEVAAGLLTSRVLPLCLFALVLAGVVYAVRWLLIKRERTASAAEAVRAEIDGPTPGD
jgi:hypothetical protein